MKIKGNFSILSSNNQNYSSTSSEKKTEEKTENKSQSQSKRGNSANRLKKVRPRLKSHVKRLK